MAGLFCSAISRVTHTTRSPWAQNPPSQSGCRASPSPNRGRAKPTLSFKSQIGRAEMTYKTVEILPQEQTENVHLAPTFSEKKMDKEGGA